MSLIVDFHELVRGALTEGSVLQFGKGLHPIKVLVDPQPSALSALLDQAHRGTVRGSLIDNKLYLWDSYDATHSDMASLLKSKHGSRLSFIVSKSIETLYEENDWDAFPYFASGQYYLLLYYDNILRDNARFDRLFPNLRAIDVRQQEWFDDGYKFRDYEEFLAHDKSGYAAKLERDSQP